MNGLPGVTINSNLANFSIYYQTNNSFSTSVSGNVPIDTDWGLEISMDVQFAHSVAPYANIVLILAKAASYNDLIAAIHFGNTIPNVVSMSMSWGGSEYSNLVSLDKSVFTNSNIIYCAASGDDGSYGGIIWPSVSSNVISVGGTQLTQLKPRVIEKGWSGSGGGKSNYFSMPSYQKNVGLNTKFNTTKRLNPDICSLAYPCVSIYNSTPPSGTPSGWSGLYGGTSLASPIIAGMIASSIQSEYINKSLSNWKYVTRSKLYTNIYNRPTNLIRDITLGSNGSYNSINGYDLVSGNGSLLYNNLSNLIN